MRGLPSAPELIDALKSEAATNGVAYDDLNTALAAAQVLSAAAKAAADADGGADAGTVTAVDDADAAIQALTIAGLSGACEY